MKETIGNQKKNMPLGQVYLWTLDPSRPLRGVITKETVPLPLSEFDRSPTHSIFLENRFVSVENAGKVNIPTEDGGFLSVPMGNAIPDENGNFIFEPYNGGGRMDKQPYVEEYRREKNIHASHFGEVNSFYQISLIAIYVDKLLSVLGEHSLPKVKVIVNAHQSIYSENEPRDGVRGEKSGKWLPFQGGHYRLSQVGLTHVKEYKSISAKGEIHLGPGWRLTEDGALPEFAKCKYRDNASHNAGIIYHEYGHHINRYTADFMANRLSAPHKQINRKTELDEGFADYWAATMLDCPNIWAFHRKHTKKELHQRSLASNKNMSDYLPGKNTDPHLNGTILAATLWDIRQDINEKDGYDYRIMDLLVLKSLILIGGLYDSNYRPTKNGTVKCRSGFSLSLEALLQADKILFEGKHQNIIQQNFEKRGIKRQTSDFSQCGNGFLSEYPSPNLFSEQMIRKSIQHILKKDQEACIPYDNELMVQEKLENFLFANKIGPFSLVAVGDIMLGERMNRPIRLYGPEYPFYSVLPIFRRSNIVLGNLEGPFAKHAEKQKRNFTYKVDPKNARILRRVGFNVLTLANNHLLDCGREGVNETLTVLRKQGIFSIGAGEDESKAHEPAIFQAGKFKIGILAYYWNKRTSANKNKPGSAMDTPEKMAIDIRNLRKEVDRIVVTVHWGIPYEQIPLEEDRKKAFYAIDCGADIVIGHHPHIVQPFEIYKNRPVFYSIGNFAFGTGNSRAEAIILGVDFQDLFTNIIVFPAYVKNRDKRIYFQPKVINGETFIKYLNRLKQLSAESGELMKIEGSLGIINVPFK